MVTLRVQALQACFVGLAPKMEVVVDESHPQPIQLGRFLRADPDDFRSNELTASLIANPDNRALGVLDWRQEQRAVPVDDGCHG